VLGHESGRRVEGKGPAQSEEEGVRTSRGPRLEAGRGQLLAPVASGSQRPADKRQQVAQAAQAGGLIAHRATAASRRPAGLRHVTDLQRASELVKFGEGG
jgi:hypothetical protein